MEEKKNTGMDFEDIDGLVIVVDKTKKEFPLLPTKEWILAKVNSIKKQLPTRKGWNAQLNWEFVILEEEFKGRKFWLNTGLVALPDSKLYKTYAALTGRDELDDKEEIKLSGVIEMVCYVMLENSTKKKGKQIIMSLKHSDEQKKNDTSKDVEETTKKAKVKKEEVEVKKEKIDEESESSGIDEINLDDINIDDIG